MKKRSAIILCAIIATTFLTACGGGAAGDYAPMQFETTNMWSEPASPMSPPMADSDDSQSLYLSASDTTGSSIAGITAPVIEGFAEKIIYSVYADIETIEFNETIAGVNALIVSYGAFIENSNISGQNYASQFYGWNEHRYANFTIRVPKEHLNAMTGHLDSLGNIVQLSSNATNITSQFIDTESHLNSLTTQEERLLSMLAQADDVADLILLEERLSNIRYQIESITSTLKNWQNQVDYSTLTLNIREVEQYTERVEIHRTYWQQIGDGFMSSMRGVGRFFMELFKWLIVSAPVLIILAVIAVAVIIIVRKKMKSIAKKKANMPKAPAYQYPPAYGQSYAPPPTEPPSAPPPSQESETAKPDN